MELLILPKKGFKWNQLGLLANHFYDKYATHSFKELLTLFDQTVRDIITIINGCSDTHLYKIGYYPWRGNKWPLGRWISINTASPYKSACAKVRKWKKTLK